MVFNKMLRAFAVGVVLLAICVAYLNSAAATAHRAQTAQKRRAALADNPSIVRPWPGCVGDRPPYAREPGGGLDHLMVRF